MQGLGALLRERRDAMGVTLAEVEVATRIRQKYLSALEADEWHLLPGEVVGRGFLRNYADYLGMEPQEMVERRRVITDPNLSVALSTTSAGAPLPPERSVDYRPKEVELKDEGDGIQRGEIRLTPILAIVGVALLVALAWWGVSVAREPLGEMLAGIQRSSAGLLDRADPTPATPVMAVINEDNLDGSPTPAAVDAAPPAAGGVVILGSGGTADSASSGGAAGQSDAPAVVLPSPTPVVILAEPTPTPELPTATPEPPTPEPPTATPEPPTATPEPPAPELPTATPEPPTPAPPAVVAPACGDARSVITSPGVGQVLSGVVGVTGSATHEAFQYSKLEYAAGANAGGGFVYFDGSNVQVSGGLLGNFDTRALPNGDYTIRLTVVDQSGNFPPPCDVSVVIAN